MKIGVICQENYPSKEPLKRIDEDIVLFRISNKVLSYSELFNSAFSTPARYVMEIYRRLRSKSDPDKTGNYFIFNPFFHFHLKDLEKVAAILKNNHHTPAMNIKVFEDKSGTPIGYLLPSNLDENEIHFLTLLSTMNGKIDAACLRNSFLIHTDEEIIKNISLKKEHNPGQFYYNQSYENIYCWITSSTMEVIKKFYGRILDNSHLKKIDQADRERLKSTRDAIPFTAIMPHHASDILFLALAAQNTRTHIKRVVVNRRYEEILKNTAPNLETVTIPIPPPFGEGKNKTEEEYFQDVVEALDKGNQNRCFYNYLKPLRNYRFTDFHLVDHLSFALGSKYLNSSDTYKHHPDQDRDFKNLVKDKINVLLHFEGEFPLKTYPEIYQDELIDILYKAGYQVTVLSSREPRSSKYSTVKYKNFAWYQELLTSQQLIIGIDSFPLQYAAHVMNIPSICIFGPSKPAATGAKVNKYYHFIDKNMPCDHCRPFDRCYANGKPVCFNYTEPTDVFKAAVKMLNEIYGDSHKYIVSKIAKEREKAISPVKILAIYFPQFHRLPENDMWWGNGFTEWINVTKAKPQFKGHYQPRLPSELGFCDIMVPGMREEQARLARRYGIYAFCYYHYWFNGRRILEKAVDRVIESGEPDLPFCFCWANENWTKRWDGSTFDVQLLQNYSHEDDLEHILHLIPIFKDRRYITIEGKPIFFVYRIELLPNPKKTAEIWREEIKKAGFPGIYLGIFENFKSGIDPGSLGFDAAVEFGPDIRCLGEPMYWNPKYDEAFQDGEIEIGYRQNKVYSYNTVVKNTIAKPDPPYKRFRGAFPSWDNSPRRPTIKGSTIVHGSTPEKFEVFVEKIIDDTYRLHKGEERLVFINAWNEWAEGCYIEPDSRFGLGYLEAIRNAVLNTNYIPELEMKKEQFDQKNFMKTREIKLKKLEEKINRVLNTEPEPFNDVDNLYMAQLFVDTGNGFDEETSIWLEINGRERHLEFELRSFKDIQQLRFDPIANVSVVVRIDEVKVEDEAGKTYRFSNFNSNEFAQYDNILIFKSIDSQIYLKRKLIANPSKITIRLEYIAIGDEADFYIREYTKFQEKNQEFYELKDEKNEMISQLKMSKSYRIGRAITWPIRVLVKLKKRLITRLK